MLIRSDDLLSGKYGKSGHFVRFYDDGDIVMDEVAAFLRQAVGAGGKGIVIATPDHVDVLRRRLGTAAVRVAWMDADAMLARFMVEGWPDPARFDATVGTAVQELELDLAAVNGPLLSPGVGAQGGTSEDLRRVFGDALPNVLPASSREVLSAGPDVAALRDRAVQTSASLAAILR